MTTAKNMDQGIRQVLDKNRQPISVRWHYLGIDALPDEDHREDAAKEGQRTVAQFDPDAIIAVDDEAQQYVAQLYAGLSRPKIIFTAIDHDPKEFGYVGAANVTGILEILPLTAIREALQQIRPGQPMRLAVLGTPTPTGKGQLRQINAFDWGPHKLVDAQLLGDFAAWQQAIKAMEGKADVLVVLSHDGLKVSPTSTSPAPLADVIRWIEANAKPLPIGISTDYVELGGGLSLAPSSRAMGEVAAIDTLQWLKAKPASAPPPISEGKHYSVAIRASALQSRGVKLPSIYTEAARLDQLYFP